MIDELSHFLQIAEQGTFTKAAKRAHLSQPALTAAIQRLEQTMGAKLFDRGRGGVQLTAAGQALVPHARAVLTSIADGRRAVDEVLALRAGEVRLGAGATSCTYLLPPLLFEFRARFPGLHLTLREATSAEALDAIEAGELDLAVVAGVDGVRERQTLTLEHWRDDAMVLVAAPSLAAELAGDPSRIDRAPFVAFSRGTTRILLDRHFPSGERAMELGSLAAIKGNARAGIGVALLSRSALDRDLQLGTLELVPHPATPLHYTLSLAHRGVDRLPPAAAALRSALLTG
ncbi:LysR family transcriptional regulator [Nannocystaceae bacterium ST9]